MALPKINETLNFNMKVPSTGKTVKYRPYLVKEEKILLQAFESGDTKTCLEAMVDTLDACIDPKSKLDVKTLSTFDVEYLFIKVRAKSVGESSAVNIKCSKCEESNPYSIDLESIEVDIKDTDNVIQITDDIAVEMKYPTYEQLMNDDIASIEREDIDAAMRVLAGSISAVLTEEERIDCSKQSIDEVVDFLQSMTASQLKGISEFLENMPALRQEIVFDCKKCGEHNELELKGLADFF